MLGQLQDAGNTSTLAHYLELLSQAGLMAGLAKYSGSRVRQRGSSPKLLVLNTALMSAHLREDQAAARRTPEIWGRLVESAIGAHLVNSASASLAEVSWWRDGRYEVDFVVSDGRALVAIEVTSGRRKDRLLGLETFVRQYPQARPLLVGAQGISLEAFLARPAADWL
jgi:predicted AAA+ superfamily ATPase